MSPNVTADKSKIGMSFAFLFEEGSSVSKKVAGMKVAVTHTGEGRVS